MGGNFWLEEGYRGGYVILNKYDNENNFNMVSPYTFHWCPVRPGLSSVTINMFTT